MVLKLRLLSDSNNIENEWKIYEDLKNFQSVFGILRMLQDKQTSNVDNNNLKSIKFESEYGGDYKEEDLNTKKMYVLTLSLNVWDINFKLGNMSSINIVQFQLIPYKFYIYMKSYNEFYKKTYDNKRDLIWYLHMGEIVMSNMYQDKKSLLKLL